MRKTPEKYTLRVQRNPRHSRGSFRNTEPFPTMKSCQLRCIRMHRPLPKNFRQNETRRPIANTRILIMNPALTHVD